MTTMKSMNPDAPGFVDASAAASRYANFVNQPKYEVANKYFDDLKKEKADEEAAAENLRRYNQGFALQQAEANRQQATYDKANRSDKALLDYQSSLANASVGGAMNDAQGVELANEFDRLKQSMSEEQAAEIINNKAQAYGQADRKKASEDPYYRAELLRNVALPNVDISPEKLITLRNSQINREIDLGDRKEEARLTAEERAFNRAMENKKFSLQQQDFNQKVKERQDKINEEKKSQQAATDAVNLALVTTSKDDSGIYKSVKQEGTGSYNLGGKVLSEEDGIKITEKFLEEKAKKVDPIEEKIKNLESSVISEDKLSDLSYLNSRYSKESINPTTQDNVFTKSFGNVYENANKIAKEDETYQEITRLTNLLSKETDPAQIEITSSEITKLKDSLDPTKNVKKTSDGKFIESRGDFAKRIAKENEEKKKEINALKNEVSSQYDSINENINKEFGNEVTKEKKITLTPDQVLKSEFNRVKKEMLQLGYSDYLSTKGAIEAGNTAAQTQRDMLNKVDSDVTKLKEKESKKLEESRKQLGDELKAYTDIRKSITTSKSFNGVSVDGFFFDKPEKAQNALDEKIASIQKQIKDINGR